MRRLRLLLTTATAAILLGTGAMAAQSAAAATHPLAPRTGRTEVVTVHMHPVKVAHGHMITGDTGTSRGDCGLAQLILHASTSTYLLTLFSTQGGMGVGTYSVNTDGFLSVATPGGINAGGATAWTSHTQRVLDPGLGASIGWVSGWVWTANAGPCGYVVTARWND
jgi:hypothetical protein